MTSAWFPSLRIINDASPRLRAHQALQLPLQDQIVRVLFDVLIKLGSNPCAKRLHIAVLCFLLLFRAGQRDDGKGSRVADFHRFDTHSFDVRSIDLHVGYRSNDSILSVFEIVAKNFHFYNLRGIIGQGVLDILLCDIRRHTKEHDSTVRE